MSQALKSLSAGDEIKLAFKREGKAQAVTVKVEKR